MFDDKLEILLHPIQKELISKRSETMSKGAHRRKQNTTAKISNHFFIIVS